MNRIRHIGSWWGCVAIAACLLAALEVKAQDQLIDLSRVDGADLTPDNLFDFSIQSQSSSAVDVIITGSIRYRNTDQRIDYHFPARLQQGVNTFGRDKVNTALSYSSQGLRELFEQYRMLPFGTYQYCVSVNLAAGENNHRQSEECVYRKAQDQWAM